MNKESTSISLGYIANNKMTQQIARHIFVDGLTTLNILAFLHIS